ncbi:hypothetical protein KP509_07G016200 [Ceratopteris richardii]|uniref:UPF3 domain-containing protein n=1 Tax=Ceratopteris richardii TaxID=49495 RepID=A0A8T2UFI3_CERRI|nr:hypothetical protein KP509_07G016200 [Ceratopteris richardii]
MINERSPVIHRGTQQHYQYDRLYPNPKLAFRQNASIDWTSTGQPSPNSSTQPQFLNQKKDWGYNLAPSNAGSFSLHPSGPSSCMVSIPGEEKGEGCNRLNSEILESSVMSGSGATSALKDAFSRTKVIVRHLPPGLAESTFMEQIAPHFSAIYSTITFYPGKTSGKGTSYSRAYIEFKHPEHVLDFYQAFNGHAFVNEKGTQYKALVEYAPNQRVPKLWSKKDPREGSIFQDPDYIKFTEQIAKPVDYLPSAEAQLEKKETERIMNSAKEAIIVTPLMEFVRQKRAMKSMPQLLAGSGKISVRGGTSSMASSGKMVLKRGTDRSSANSMYAGGSRLKEKTTYVPRYEENQRRDISGDKKGRLADAKDYKTVQEDSYSKTGVPNQAGKQSGIKVFIGTKKNILGLDKEEIINGGSSGSLVSVSDYKNGAHIVRSREISSGKSGSSHQSTTGEDMLIQRVESGGRHGKGASPRVQFLLQKSDQPNEREKRASRSQAWKSMNKELNASESDSVSSQAAEEKSEATRQDGRRLRNKDRPDRPVWTVRQRGDPAESPKNASVAPSLSPPGSQRLGRGPRDLDHNAMPDGNKAPNKRGGSSATYGGHEKQVWVAKPGSGS